MRRIDEPDDYPLWIKKAHEEHREGLYFGRLVEFYVEEFKIPRTNSRASGRKIKLADNYVTLIKSGQLVFVDGFSYLPKYSPEKIQQAKTKNVQGNSI